MEKYQATFEDNGYDDLCYMGGGLVTKEDLLEIGINDPQDCTVLIDSLKLREHKFLFDKEGKPNLKDLASGTMEEWLKSIGLSQYVDNFRFSFLCFSLMWTDNFCYKEQHGDRDGPNPEHLGRGAFLNRGN